jgi:sn-1 stearoyl-lipid 9-desaturase
MTAATPTRKLPIEWPVTLFMLVIHLGSLFAFVPSNFSWAAVGLAVLFHWITGGLGITLGWHRMVTHRSFQTPKVLEYFFVLCGALACEGGVIEWVGLHRNHHMNSDQEKDQHNSNKGFWWSHMGWMLHEVPAKADVERLTRDINTDPVYKFLDAYFLPLQIVLGMLFYLWGGWSFVVWGIFVRLVLVYHCTWFVNSATHKFGYRTHEANDCSTNCWWVALLTYGEGWHNNHHAFPHSARHGLRWWEFDMTWITIWTLNKIGLAKKLRLADI